LDAHKGNRSDAVRAIFLRSIKNKIVGKAKNVLTASEAGLNWDEIKEAFILHCSDKRDKHTFLSSFTG